MRLTPFLLLAVGAAIADFVVKRWVEASLEMHEFTPVMPGLALYRTSNTGIAFSMFDWLEGPWLILLPVIIIAFLTWLTLRTPATQLLARAGFALIVGGAVGNLIDRAMLGHVVDYVLFYVGSWSFAIFNLADACITVGAGLIILQEIRNWAIQRRQA